MLHTVFISLPVRNESPIARFLTGASATLLALATSCPKLAKLVQIREVDIKLIIKEHLLTNL